MIKTQNLWRAPLENEGITRLSIIWKGIIVYSKPPPTTTEFCEILSLVLPNEDGVSKEEFNSIYVA